MRAVLQRVTSAQVEVDGAVVGAIGAGWLAYVGAARDDDDERAARLARRIADLRVFRSSDGDGEAGDATVSSDVSVLEAGLEVLVISQFTLHADTRKGRKPSWHRAAPADRAEALVQTVVDALRHRGLVVATGVFRAEMAVTSTNDGPVTLIVDT